MPNILNIEVANLDTVLLVYDKIKIYKAPTVSGTYAEITNSGTRISILQPDTLYKYIDSGGISTDYYKTSYFNSLNSAESPLSEPVAAIFDNSVQLLPNMQVIISLLDGIKSTSGIALEPQDFYFTTTYFPLYSSIRKVRLEIGSFIQDLDDDAVNFAIFEAGLGADELTWIVPKPDINNKFYAWARREWTTCKAAQNLLMNVISGLRSKRLDNFEVTYDFQKRGQTMLDQIDLCLAKWELQLKSGGNATQKPRYVVKGEFDPDAPNVGRLWEKGPGTQLISGANARYRPAGLRRYISGWRNNSNWRRLS